MAYQEALKTQQEGYQENYMETILMFPVSSLPKDKPNPGGPFDRAIEKGVKAIKTHSIQTKPERQAGKRNDPKYKEWISRKEYNPFLHNAWMLTAKAQFHNGDFLQAVSSFSYISRLYATQPEIAIDAKIWQARCFSEMGWFYEADDILSKIKKENLSKELKDWHSTVYADFLIKQKRYSESIPYLQTAIKSEKNKVQKNREKYLLGQIHSHLGEKDLAYRAFGEVAGSTVPYILEFSAKIRQTEVYAGNDTTKITRQLRQMTKSSKNKEYLDQVYYALGNVYMAIPDSAKAIAAYELGVEKSTQQGVGKTLNQIRLGDIYFNQRKFIQAQPNYSEALGQLKKEDEAYARVSKRSEALDELVLYVEAVELQDSLQRLSKMTEEQQLEVVNKIIADLIKREKEEQKKQERDEYLAQQENTRTEMSNPRMRPSGAAGMIVPPTEEGLFYFYSPQVVSVGKTTFQQRWGRRKLEDDWRRRNKNNPLSDAFNEDELANMENTPDSLSSSNEDIPLDEKMAEMSSDPHDPQFYIQQIPVTEEDIEESNQIIIDGLYNMGIIYKDKLEDPPLALETFDQLNTRFPENENKLDAYYQIYLIYLKEENMAMANLYKQKIRAEFSGSEYAVAMADPNYEHNLRMMNIIPDSLYRETYQAYLNGNIQKVRENYQRITTRFGQSKLVPKFAFLNALSYVQTNDADRFKEALKNLISEYPEADVAVLAAEMMKGFQRGLLLSASGDNLLARGSLFNIRFGANTENIPEEIAAMSFSTETQTPYELLIVYPQGTLNDNLLLYTVASFNFGNFIVSDFDLEQTTIGNINLLQIKGFNNFPEIQQYTQMIYGAEGFASQLVKSVVIVPISLENYATLMRGKSLEEYMAFFEKEFGKENQNLVERWKLSQAHELESIAMEEEEEEHETIVNETTEEMEAPIDSTDFSPEIDTSSISETESIISSDTTEISISESQALQNQIDETFDQTLDQIDELSNKVDEIFNDPIRGIQNLFKRKPSNTIDAYAKEQEDAEKERKKIEAKTAREAEKEKSELLKKQTDEEKALLKAKQKREEELSKLKKQEDKAKVDEKKRIQKEKEDARKQKEKERKDTLKLKEQQRKAKVKAQEEAQKKKEKERKEAQKLKEQARKTKNKK